MSDTNQSTHERAVHYRERAISEFENATALPDVTAVARAIFFAVLALEARIEEVSDTIAYHD